MIIWMILGMGQSHILLLCMTQLPATHVMLATVSVEMMREGVWRVENGLGLHHLAQARIDHYSVSLIFYDQSSG